MALNLEPIYQEIFSKLKTRKKFVIRSLEKNLLTIERIIFFKTLELEVLEQLTKMNISIDRFFTITESISI